MHIEYRNDVEAAKMRKRQLISKSCHERGKADNIIQLVERDEKTFVKINDYQKLRHSFGQFLAEIQRIKSEGDYEAGKTLVETYAVKVDPAIHREVLDRYARLDIAPYKGFVSPVYKPVFDKKGNIIDVKIDYTEGYIDQMLRCSKDYSPLTK